MYGEERNHRIKVDAHCSPTPSLEPADDEAVDHTPLTLTDEVSLSWHGVWICRQPPRSHVPAEIDSIIGLLALALTPAHSLGIGPAESDDGGLPLVLMCRKHMLKARSAFFFLRLRCSSSSSSSAIAFAFRRFRLL